MIKKHILLQWIICLIPLWYQIIYLFQFNSNLLYIPILIIFAFTYKKLYCPGKFKILILASIIAYLGCSIFSGGISIINLIYIVLLISFCMIIPTMGRIFSENFITNTYRTIFCGSILLLPNSLMYINQISIPQIKDSLILTADATRGLRNYFGFKHPNSAAFFFIVMIYLVNLYFVNLYKCKLKNHIIINCFVGALGVWYFIALLSTGSRTGALSVIITILLQIALIITDKLDRFKVLVYAIVVLFVIYSIIESDLFLQLWNNSSGRNTEIIKMINGLTDNNKLLLGVGQGPISSGNISKVLGEKIIIDSWFMQLLASTGIIGFFVMIVALMFVFKECLMKQSIGYKGFNCGLIVSFIQQGLSENVIIVPGIIVSVFFWILITAIYSINDKEELV